MTKNNITKYLCIITLVSFVAVFGVLTKGSIFTLDVLKSFFNQSMATLLAGLGLLFVIAIGGTDISTGSLMGACGVFSIWLGEKIGWWCIIPSSIIIGILSGLFLGTVHTKGKVLSFMVSLCMLIGIRGAVSWTIGSGSYFVPENLLFLDEMPFKIAMLIIACLAAWYLLDFTSFGMNCKAIGENENVVRYNGEQVDRIKIMAFVLSGMMVGVSALFTLAQVGSVNNSMGVGFEMKALLAMYVAGVPVNGGFGTRLYKLICGTFTMTLLEIGVTQLNCSGPFVQLIKSIILLLMVFVLCHLENSNMRNPAHIKIKIKEATTNN